MECACLRVRPCARACGGHITTLQSRFSPSAIAGPGDQTHVARLLLCSSLFLCGWDKTDQNQPGKGSVFLIPHFVVNQGGKSQSKLKVRAGKETKEERCFLACLPGLLSSLSSISQAHLPRLAATHSALGSPPSISSNPESALLA